jgi:nitroreductase
MELHEAIGGRAMVRSFSTEPVDSAVVDRILLAALRSPTAGNTRGTAWVVLEGPEQTAIYWGVTTDDDWRTRNRTRFDGLRRAPVVLLAYASPGAYVARYARPDKKTSGLGTDPDAWPVPYWYGDAAFGVMAVLLGVVDSGLGACILGAFRGESELERGLQVPEGWRLFCAIALGWPDGHDYRSESLDQPRLDRSQRIHRGSWESPEI